MTITPIGRIELRRSTRAGGRRRGAVTLELILTLPIWIIALLAIIEWGQIIAQQQQVALASRVGAEEASQTPGMGGAGSVPPNVITAVEQQLNSSGMTSCKVIIEHNVGSVTPVTLTDGACDCDAPGAPFPPRREYTRVSVCVPLTGLAPNLLATFGFDIADCMVQHSTTFRYEL
jgi:hypothetical protein